MKKIALSLLLLSTFTIHLFAQSALWGKSPKEYYDIIGNPKYDQSDQGVAFTQLQDYSKPRAEAKYWLAEVYISGKTGEGGPIYSRNGKGFPANRPEAYKLAIPLLVEAANDDCIPAIKRLVDIFYEGKYVEKDLETAVTCLTNLVKLGDTDSIKKLEGFYTNDLSKVTDARKRFSVMEILADSGFAPAQIELSKWLIGKNAKEAFDDAKKFLIPLSKNGNIEAIQLLTRIQSIENKSMELAQKKALEEANVATLEKQKIEKNAHEKEVTQSTETKNMDESQETGNSGLIESIVWISILAILLLSILGAILGFANKLVIYNGKSDLNTTCAIIIFGVISLISFCWATWLGIVFLIIATGLFILSIRKSIQANKTVIKTFIVMPTKFTLLGFIALCGIAAIGGTLSFFQALSKNDKKEAVRSGATAVTGGIGYYYLNKLINKLVKEETA